MIQRFSSFAAILLLTCLPPSPIHAEDAVPETPEAETARETKTAEIDPLLAELALRVDEMLADPGAYTKEQWQEVQDRINDLIPDLAERQSKFKRELPGIKSAGMEDPEVVALLEEKRELEKKIKATVESLPSVQEAVATIEQAHQDLMNAFKLRVRAVQGAAMQETEETE